MDILSREQAAEYLGMSLSSFKKYQKEIPHIQLGRLVKFDVNDLDNYLKSKKVGTANECKTN